MGTVAGSRTWSDGLGSTSKVILCAVAHAAVDSGLHVVFWRHRMCRARRLGSWWRLLTTETVSYGPREICPPAPAGGGGIWARRGIHGAQRKQKTLGKKKNGNKNGGYTQR